MLGIGQGGAARLPRADGLLSSMSLMLSATNSPEWALPTGSPRGLLTRQPPHALLQMEDEELGAHRITIPSLMPRVLNRLAGQSPK